MNSEIVLALVRLLEAKKIIKKIVNIRLIWEGVSGVENKATWKWLHCNWILNSGLPAFFSVIGNVLQIEMNNIIILVIHNSHKLISRYAEWNIASFVCIYTNTTHHFCGLQCCGHRFFKIKIRLYHKILTILATSFTRINKHSI